MSDFWIAVIIVGGAAMAMKAAGPVVVGGRQFPERVMLLVSALAPALLAAFVVTSTFTSGKSLVLDERALGLAAAGVFIAFRAPLIVSIAAAATAAAIARAM